MSGEFNKGHTPNKQTPKSLFSNSLLEMKEEGRQNLQQGLDHQNSAPFPYMHEQQQIDEGAYKMPRSQTNEETKLLENRIHLQTLYFLLEVGPSRKVYTFISHMTISILKCW